MLPGFRFLCAAIVLSISLLIFGLGAAALLRAAHEEFASIPSRRPPPEVMFVQREDAAPTLAMLRAEPSVVDEKAAEPPPIADPVQDQPAIIPAPTKVEKPVAEPDKVAALDTATPVENAQPSEPPTSEAAAPESPIPAETQAQADAPSAETKLAAIAEMTPRPSNESAATMPDQAAAPIDEGTRIAETIIATLGGPPVTIGTRTPSKIAPAVKKHAQARRIVKRRRIAPVRVTQHAPQTPADPFARPFGR
jgi:hypothetical protein